MARGGKDDLARGAAFMVTSALFFAAMGAAAKLASRTLPNTMVVFFRAAFGLLVMAPWVAHVGLGGLRTSAWKEHLFRGVAGLGAQYCFFYSIAHLRLADAILLNHSIPLFLPLISRLWLKERFPRGLWRPLLVGFVGIGLILKPGLALFQPVALVALAAAFLGALAQTGVRRLTRTEPAARIVFYFGVVSTSVSAMPLLGTWTSPRPGVWLVLGGLGLLATLGQLGLTEAYASAPAPEVGPFLYTSVVFAGLMDYVFWNARPDLLSAAGAIFVCAAGILTLRTSPAHDAGSRREP